MHMPLLEVGTKFLGMSCRVTNESGTSTAESAVPAMWMHTH